MIKDSAWTLGLFIVIYSPCVEPTYGIGTNGSTKQGGDVYFKIYSQSSKDLGNWPTKHYTNKRAFWYWTWSTAKVSFSNVGTAFTRDVRGAIQTKKEHLFIVYDDAPPEGDPFFDLPFIKKEPSKDKHSLKGAYIFH
ncbi:hypothetical protein BEWA_053760 [Theileria equi strain WA]|uniref:Signal peptide-containing protein n=1 Tax=Theileria equi strain WA TaxID=1537102 RepID=L1LDA9_THEEQ|nr:hypothetical protein BEWA_053760 [Theileria equi strain WA]EKX73321.1 hypothetical protein BEWA_053760 [Theileria equi strain WA]|eukprot:XP_004832773.1 hypothetical protein BEWA_053760 [Theileria equi strain WA]